MNPSDRLDEHNVAVFLFHGVIERCDHAVRNYTRKHVAAAAFARMIADLRRTGTPLSMDQVLWHLENHAPFPPRAFAITFDDGFENNLTVAAPILTRHGVPATFYLTTQFVDRNAMSWIDMLEYCVEQTPGAAVALPWRESPLRCYTIEERIALLDEIRNHVKRDSRLNRAEFVRDVFEQCGVRPVISSDDPLDRKLTWSQARALAAHDLFTLGGHSHSHATLSFLGARELDHEITESLRLLRQNTSLAPRHYSYPEGLQYCYSRDVIRALKSGGVRCSPTAVAGTNDCRTDPFEIRRIMLTDTAEGAVRAPSAAPLEVVG